jgi:hypothetical protein
MTLNQIHPGSANSVRKLNVDVSNRGLPCKLRCKDVDVALSVSDKNRPVDTEVH